MWPNKNEIIQFSNLDNSKAFGFLRYDSFMFVGEEETSSGFIMYYNSCRKIDGIIKVLYPTFYKNGKKIDNLCVSGNWVRIYPCRVVIFEKCVFNDDDE